MIHLSHNRYLNASGFGHITDELYWTPILEWQLVWDWIYPPLYPLLSR